jgi:uncharacterized protein YhbP (UPF0306 family)
VSVPQPLPAAVAELLALPALTLSTCGADGAHAAPVYFASLPGARLVFYSDKDSQHSLDLAADPRAAAAIYPLVDDYRAIHGLQLRGAVRAVEKAGEQAQAWASYARKFPFVVALGSVIRRNRLYLFEPAWLRLVDNRVKFGHVEEWTLA